MKKRHQIYLITILLVLFFSSCNKNPDTPAQPPELTVSSTSLGYSEKNSAQTIQVVTNTANYEVSIPSGLSIYQPKNYKK